ncbi:hypothetical protein ElyMa_004459000 [Elysia marginata]|uniref:Uncharacterized protein n=1 Tax=Elysia marginata TaxID=1093978 RepID=A0AAV4HH48_9GAST|nr:hypothetical protein ElyMa_004459000 [Elysia marginata]
MAHRLPPAGIKTEVSEHFAFNQVLPKQYPKRKAESTQQSECCMLRPRLVALPRKIRECDAQGKQYDVQFCCRPEDTDDPCNRRQRNTSPRPKPQCEDIILIKPLEKQELEKKGEGEPCCRIPDMRRREASLTTECYQREKHPVFIELVRDPFETFRRTETRSEKKQDNCVRSSKSLCWPNSLLDKCEDSLDAQAGSLPFCYSMEGPPGRDRSLIPVVPRDC